MPYCFNEKQLTTLQANFTRLVTKIRWAIEVVNELFKNEFKAIEKCRNTMLNHIFKDYRIAASLINCFFSRLVSDKEDGKEIAKIMKDKLYNKNDLESYLNKNNDSKKLSLIDGSLVNDFPKVNLDDIRKYITLGNSL